MYETLLFLHVLGAFLLVAMLGLYWAFYAGSDSLVRLSRIAFPLWGLGSLAVLVFGIWLAFDVSGYQLWDAWIVVAIVLWLVQGAFGSQLSQGYKRMADGTVAQRPALSAHVVATAAVALLLIDMIWKPGA
jgi:hypothetical protein